jgi:hypothetical protein
MIHLYSPDNPRRPVNWRYERARSIGEGGHPLSRRHDDEWVHRAWKFRQAFAACGNEVDHAILAHRAGDIYWAHDIWYTDHTNQEGGNPFKSEIEARLLAADSRENIATRLATRPSVVDAYERVFFNIEERRVNRGYLVHQVIGPSIYMGFQEQDYDVVWKLFALMGGPVVLDMMIDGFVGAGRPSNPSELTSFLIDTTQTAIRRKAMLAATKIKINTYNAVELVINFLKLLEIERAAGRGAAGSEALLDNVDMMLKALPIQVGSRVTHVDVPELDLYDNRGAELRCEEVVAVGLGQDVPARTVLDKYAYPPPPERPIEALQLTEGH